MLRRNGLPRDFHQMKKILKNGTNLYMDFFGHTHKGVFSDGVIINEDKDICKSPLAFSRYVVEKYSNAQPPSGWSKIYVKLDKETGAIINLDMLYDRYLS